MRVTAVLSLATFSSIRAHSKEAIAEANAYYQQSPQFHFLAAKTARTSSHEVNRQLSPFSKQTSPFHRQCSPHSNGSKDGAGPWSSEGSKDGQRRGARSSSKDAPRTPSKDNPPGI